MNKRKIILRSLCGAFAVLSVVFWFLQSQPIIKGQKYTLEKSPYSSISDYDKKGHIIFYKQNRCVVVAEDSYNVVREEKTYFYEDGKLIVSSNPQMNKSEMSPISNSIFIITYKNETFSKPLTYLFLSLFCLGGAIITAILMLLLTKEKQKLKELEKGD